MHTRTLTLLLTLCALQLCLIKASFLVAEAIGRSYPMTYLTTGSPHLLPYVDGGSFKPPLNEGCCRLKAYDGSDDDYMLHGDDSARLIHAHCGIPASVMAFAELDVCQLGGTGRTRSGRSF